MYFGLYNLKWFWIGKLKMHFKLYDMKYTFGLCDLKMYFRFCNMKIKMCILVRMTSEPFF